MPWPKPTLARYRKRFWEKVDKTPGQGIGDCWLWRGGLREGYGAFYMNGRTIGAHRVSLFLSTGVWPENACHHCDIRSCVRTSHLFNGTLADNAYDSKLKGRNGYGSRNAAAKLTEDQILVIRNLYAAGGIQSELARRFRINTQHVSAIVRGRVWKKVPLVLVHPHRLHRSGTLNYHAKLDEKVIPMIRCSPLSQRKLSAIYGVSHNVIGRIKRREAWKHV